MDKKKYIVKMQLNKLIYTQDVVNAKCDSEAQSIARDMMQYYSEDGWIITNMTVKAIDE